MFFFLLLISDIVHMLEVQVTIPQAVKKGESANLICRYNLEGDTLYSIKWYKGRREFFRFTPKENPAKKTFPLIGITVEVSFIYIVLLYRSSGIYCIVYIII